MDCTRVDILLANGKFPGDVTVIILSNLPVKSLLRFKSVSKNWRCLISSTFFIKLHLNRQSVIANNILLSLKNSENGDSELSLVSHNYDISKIPPPWQSVEYEDLSVVDSCNGLVCFRFGNDIPQKNILWNPATRRYRSLKTPKEHPFFMMSLGFVEATNDYKIVGVTIGASPNFNQCLYVYTLSSDSWKKLDYTFNNIPIAYFSQTFINGCIHWLRDTCSFGLVNDIFALDVEDEVMRCFGVPDKYDHRLSMRILAIKGCLSVVFYPEESKVMESGIEIWVMSEYGVEGSWVKQFTIQGLTTKLVAPLRSWKDSEILFMKKKGMKKLMFYEPSSKKKNFVYLGCNVIEPVQAFNYLESLASVE